MSYTQTDLDKIKQAELDLVMGKRVVSLTFNGRTTTFQQANLDDLRYLKKVVANSIGSASGKIKRVVVTTDCKSRGF